MKTWAGIFISLLAVNQAAIAAVSSGSSALALTSIISTHSPLLNLEEKSALEQLFTPSSTLLALSNKRILVDVAEIMCKQSNVDITARSCELTFGAKKITVKGREAHELFATIAEIGVSSEGAMGTIYEGLSHLVCTIDPTQIKQMSGGGAECTFDSGPL